MQSKVGGRGKKKCREAEDNESKNEIEACETELRKGSQPTGKSHPSICIYMSAHRSRCRVSTKARRHRSIVDLGCDTSASQHAPSIAYPLYGVQHSRHLAYFDSDAPQPECRGFLLRLCVSKRVCVCVWYPLASPRVHLAPRHWRSPLCKSSRECTSTPSACRAHTKQAKACGCVAAKNGGMASVAAPLCAHPYTFLCHTHTRMQTPHAGKKKEDDMRELRWNGPK